MKDAIIDVFTTLFGLIGIASLIIFIWNLVSFINLYLFIGSIVALVVVVLIMTIEDLYKESSYYYQKTSHSGHQQGTPQDNEDFNE